MDRPELGFVGLGLMGSAMVERLQALGYPLTVLGNRSRAPIDAAVARGAVEAKSGRDLAARCGIVMLCMDTSASVESRMEGSEGIIAGLRPGAVVIDFGTSLPASTRRLGALVAERGATMLDAPLGRTPSHAREGKLNIMGAGDAKAFATVRPVLGDLGENVFHLGELGAGHTIKLINNFFGMSVATAMSEAFAAADRAGIDRRRLYEVIAAGPLHSGMMDFVAAYGLEGDPEKLAFTLRNALKDVTYYREMTSGAGFPSIVSDGPHAALEGAVAAGFGERNVSEIIDFLAGAER